MVSMPKILVVDDDPWQNDAVCDWLLSEKFAVDQAFSCSDARACLSLTTYDLIVLDWQLPDGEGVELIADSRKKGLTVPIIMLTGKNTLDDKEIGFRSGADDYLTKPFHPRELSMRVHALLRRPAQYVDEEVHAGDLILLQSTKTVTINGQTLTLTPKEFDILALLAKYPGKVFSSDTILTKLWESDSETTSDIIRKYVQRLRSKIEKNSTRVSIQTHHGVGYSLSIATQASSTE